ncbi:MAG TPA: metallophosphoesterase [Chthoniobacterales bacterium]|nr:metallophosphoesterase [Chthoniobacterales bacterium]
MQSAYAMALTTRRSFLRTLGVVVSGATGVGLYTWRIEPHWLESVSRPLPIVGLPSALVGRRLVQLSDIHVGRRVDDDYLLATFAKVAALEPDLVVMTGDFISYHDAIWPQMERVFRSFPRGRLATLGILGNHDYGINWAHPEVANRVAEVNSGSRSSEISATSSAVCRLSDWTIYGEGVSEARGRFWRRSITTDQAGAQSQS